VIKSRTIKWAGLVALWVKKVRDINGWGGGSLRERDPMADLDLDRKIIFTWISKNGLFWLRRMSSGGLL